VVIHDTGRDQRFEDVVPLDERTLSDEHCAYLQEDSGLTLEIIKGRGYFSLSRSQIYELSNLNVLPSAAVEARSWLGIPIYRLDGVKHGEMIRLFGGPPGLSKYLWPMGMPLTFDIHPDQFDLVYEPKAPVLFTEGTKKADALLSACRREGYRALVIGVSGAYGWRTRINESSVASPDLDEIAWTGREVTLIPDSDVISNSQVWDGWIGFTKKLAWKTQVENKRTRVFLAFVPPADESLEKQGVDDYLKSGKTLVSLLAKRKLPEIIEQDTPPDPPRLVSLEADQLMKEAGERIPHLVASLVPEASIMLVAGHSGTFKTWAMLSMGIDGALGLPWMTHPRLRAETGPYTALYVNKEMSGKILGVRLKLLLAHDRYASIIDLDTRLAGRLHFVHDASLDLSTETGLWQITDLIERTGSRLVVLDSLSMVWHGDENSASEVGAFYTELRQITERTGVTWVIIHHLLKPTSGTRRRGDPITAAIRGSGQLVQQADVVIILETREGKALADSEKLIQMVHAKARTDTELAPWVTKFANPDGIAATFGYMGAVSEIKHLFTKTTDTTEGGAPRGPDARKEWILKTLATKAPKMLAGAGGMYTGVLHSCLTTHWAEEFGGDAAVPANSTWNVLIKALTDDGLMRRVTPDDVDPRQTGHKYVLTSTDDQENMPV